VTWSLGWDFGTGVNGILGISTIGLLVSRAVPRCVVSICLVIPYGYLHQTSHITSPLIRK
jgi:hypothetical protein